MLKKILIVAVVLGGIIFGVYKYVMKPVPNTASLKAQVTCTVDGLVGELEAMDTTKLNSYTNKVIQITGLISKVQYDSSAVTYILGNQSPSEIICQMDARENAPTTAQGSITVKGIATGYLLDDIGLGANMQLKNTVVVK
jgi:hypothetical protein